MIAKRKTEMTFFNTSAGVDLHIVDRFMWGGLAHTNVISLEPEQVKKLSELLKQIDLEHQPRVEIPETLVGCSFEY